MRRAIAVMVCLALIMFGGSNAEELRIAAKACILMEYETGRVMHAQNADERLPIASTTKIMTCMLALKQARLTDDVTAGPNASGVPGTSIYLSEGETLTMEQMLYGMMLRSGNDAAVAIAEHVAGSVPAFADMMNARAEELGADAYFTTPNGLDEGDNGASARAIAEITREALRSYEFREIVKTQKKIIPWIDREYARVLTNKNKLLSTYEGALGVKTGFTSKAGRCLVFAAERNDMLLVGAVLNCPNWFAEAERMLEYGFGNYTMSVLLSEGERVHEANVAGAGNKSARLLAATPLRAPLREGEDCRVTYAIGELTAPIKAGDVCGYAYAHAGGERIAACALIAAEDVDEMSFSNAFAKVIGRWPLF